MNDKQKTTVKTCAVIAVLMLIFPPMVEVFPHGAESSLGFGFILGTTEGGNFNGMLNIWQLLAQWLLVIGVGAALYHIQHDPAKKSVSGQFEAIEIEAMIAKQKARRANIQKQLDEQEGK